MRVVYTVRGNPRASATAASVLTPRRFASVPPLVNTICSRGRAMKAATWFRARSM
jgi:hypothetical protein